MLFSIRERTTLFPVTRDHVYLNHAAVGPMPDPVTRAAGHYLHEISFRGDDHWEETGVLGESLRQKLAGMLGVNSEETAFVRNVTEGLNILATGLDWQPGENVLLPAIEFPANVYPWLNLEKRGVAVRFVPIRDGRIDPADVADLMDRRTRVLSISSVQFLNGHNADLDALGSLCADRNIIFCVDAIQHLGAMPLNPTEHHIDFLAGGAHKWFMAGEGLGFIFCRRDLADRLEPAYRGWMGVRHWEDFLNYDQANRPASQKFETGSLSALGIHTLNASIDFLSRWGWDAIGQRIEKLTGRITEHAREREYILVTPSGTHSGIVSFKIPGRAVQKTVDALADRGFNVSARNGVIRVSPHFYNTIDEIDDLFGQLDLLSEQDERKESGL